MRSSHRGGFRLITMGGPGPPQTPRPLPRQPRFLESLSSLAAVALAGAVITAGVSWYTVGVYLPTLNTPRTSLQGVPHEPGQLPLPPGLARRLSVVIVDGLAYDAARALDELRPLRRLGVFRSLAVEFPSYTSPALVSFVTGLGPRDSGTRRNGGLDPVVGLDSVLIAAGDLHVPVTLFSRGFTDFARIVGALPGTPVYDGEFALGVELGRRRLAGGPVLEPFDGKSPARALDLIHWGEFDESSHRHGTASTEARQAARDAASFLASFVGTMDLEQDSLVVVSDHGHLPEGGHGGDEPVVSHAFFLGLGGIFRQGVELGERPMRDVASTLSILGGLRPPSSNLGLPMLDALSIDEVTAQVLMTAPFDEAARFLCQLHPEPRCSDVAPLVERLRRKPDAEGLEEMTALHAELTLDRARALDARRAAGGPRRLGVAAASLALLALIGAQALVRRKVLLRQGLTPAAALAPIVNAGVYAAMLWALDYRPTFSHLMPVPYFALDAIRAGVAAAVAVGLLARITRLGRYAPWLLLGATLAPFVLLAAWVGADPVTPPPNVAGVLVFLLAPAVPAAWVGAMVMAWVERRRA